MALKDAVMRRAGAGQAARTRGYAVISQGHASDAAPGLSDPTRKNLRHCVADTARLGAALKYNHISVKDSLREIAAKWVVSNFFADGCGRSVAGKNLCVLRKNKELFVDGTQERRVVAEGKVCAAD